jgi:hypothetical protein
LKLETAFCVRNVIVFCNRTKKVHKLRRVEMKGMISAICVVLCVVGSAFGAGGGQVNSLGGSFHPEGYDGPQWSSYSYEMDNPDSAQGSFNIQLDAKTASLEDANWNFWTNSYDTQYWSATCYMHGRRDRGEEYPQSQYWSQTVNQEDLRIDASLSFHCYDEYGNETSNLQAQIASLQAYLLALTDPDKAQEITAQIQSLQVYLGQLETKDEQILAISGYFTVSPSDLLSSHFSYREEIRILTDMIIRRSSRSCRSGTASTICMAGLLPQQLKRRVDWGHNSRRMFPSPQPLC